MIIHKWRVKVVRHLASVDVIEVDETKEIFYCESIECVNYEEWCAFRDY